MALLMAAVASPPLDCAPYWVIETQAALLPGLARDGGFGGRQRRHHQQATHRDDRRPIAVRAADCSAVACWSLPVLFMCSLSVFSAPMTPPGGSTAGCCRLVVEPRISRASTLGTRLLRRRPCSSPGRDPAPRCRRPAEARLQAGCLPTPRRKVVFSIRLWYSNVVLAYRGRRRRAPDRHIRKLVSSKSTAICQV